MVATRAAPVVYAIETLTDALWGELEPLLQAHWHEVAHYADIPLEPACEVYAKISGNGGMRVYTARIDVPERDRGRLVGYLGVLVARSLHYASSVFANQDVLYVAPEHRGSRVGVNLIRYAHDALRAEGVRVILQHVKHREDINVGPVLGRMGYEHVDDIWAFRLDRC